MIANYFILPSNKQMGKAYLVMPLNFRSERGLYEYKTLR